MDVSIVVPARNEEDYIGRTLEALLLQDNLKEVVVVNDGSTDGTSSVCKASGVRVIDLPTRDYDAGGMPELAKVINIGIEAIERDMPDYLLIMGADHIIPPGYIKALMERMESDPDVVVASGIIEGEVTREFAPRGSGRMVRVPWWSPHGLRYPESYGWEAWLIFRALKDKKKVLVEDSLVGTVQRPTGKGLNRARNWGKAMRALNYWKPYALARIVRQFMRSPRRGFAMLGGYLSDVKKLDDVADFVPAFQTHYVWGMMNQKLGR